MHQDKVAFHNKHFDKFTAEQKSITKMMDNLYMDKLRGRITEDDYERHHQTLKLQQEDVASRLEKLKEAESDYYQTATYVLNVLNRAYDLFMSSEVDEKRQLIKLVLSNLRIDGENVVYDVQKPFNLIVNCSDDQVWRPQGDLNPCFRRERAMS